MAYNVKYDENLYKSLMRSAASSIGSRSTGISDFTISAADNFTCEIADIILSKIEMVVEEPAEPAPQE